MNDPRLNSVHLEFPRREDFRRAREILVGSRGQHTIAAEQIPPAFASSSHTLVHEEREGGAASAEHWLVDQGSTYPLKVGVNTIGRLPDNDVVIEGPYVSRRHCAILVHAGNRCELYDIASKNGTFVNGAKLGGPTHLANGDEIRMCDRLFVFMSKRAGQRVDEHDNTLTE
jgi:pSer/pThr/pTyr-binding forkhead associated (FHA) protein